jgi:DNA (cytosine-5)-methyltransferase 1
MSWAYYNEIDPFAAAWLRELIKAGLIAPGEVDERSIEDVVPSDLSGFTQCHFFAGIGVWSYALRLAGWPDDRPVWTGSCPCQPFSAAGQGGGFVDERHLWPAFFHLISVHKPGVVFGEQVASKDGLAWLDLVQTDMEGAGYSCGAVDLCAAGVGAPHIRNRLFFVADSSGGGTGSAAGNRADEETEAEGVHRGTPGAGSPSRDCGASGRVADALPAGRAEGRSESGGDRSGLLAHSASPRHDGQISGAEGEARDEARLRLSGKECGDGILADSCGESGRRITGRPQAHEDQDGRKGRNRLYSQGDNGHSGHGQNLHPGPTNGFWRDADWLCCTDGKWRAVEPGSFPLAHGAPARVGRLRGYGNAINAQAAAEVIRAYMEGRG